MPHGIVDGLLGGEEQVVALDGIERQGRQLLGHIETAADAGQREVVLGELAKESGEAFQRVVAGIDGPDNLAEAAGIGFGAAENFIQGLARRIIVRQLLLCEIADHGDFRQIGAEVVVEISSDAGALHRQRVFAVKLKPGDIAPDRDDHAGRHQGDHRPEPPLAGDGQHDGEIDALGRAGFPIAHPDAPDVLAGLVDVGDHKP